MNAHPAVRLLVAAAVCVAAFLSFQYNLFGVAADDLYKDLSTNSEALVIDGIVRMQRTPDETPMLGFLRDPNAPDAQAPNRSLSAPPASATEFAPYRSQFGLQLYPALWLHRAFGASVETLQSVNSGLLALAVGAMVLLVGQAFGLAGALAFGLAWVLSPWTVGLAKNLYWVEWTWLLPMLVMTAWSRRVLERPGQWLWIGPLYFLGMLAKMLCGYEYLTTIALASAAPFVYAAFKARAPIARTLAGLATLGVLCVAAFGLALWLHASKAAGPGESGTDHIMMIAKKRMYASDVDNLARTACLETPVAGRPACERTVAESLRASPIAVVGRYLVFQDFAPWLSRASHPPSEAFRDALKQAGAARSIAQAKALVAGASWNDLSSFVVRGINTVLFAALVLLTVRAVVRWPGPRSPIVWCLAVSALAAISWFVAAKAHSAIHTSLNFVLWWLPFVPLALAVIAGRRAVGRRTGH
jgi:hypothetical protein